MGANFNSLLVHGSPAEASPRVVAEIDTQLLVMGTASRIRLGGFIIGNTAESVLNQAPSPHPPW